MDLMANSFRISSFSTDPLSILMWAHYADSNKGICLEYDISDYKDNAQEAHQYEAILPVLYYESPFNFSELLKLPDLLSVNDKLIAHCFAAQVIRKPSVWQYENEWRLCTQLNEQEQKKIIIIDQLEFLQFIKPQKLILGTKFDSSDERRLREKLDGIEITRVQQSKTEYKLLLSE